MGEINYDIEFVERTKKIIAEYKGEYKLTILLNCMIGLVILPNERLQNIAPELWNRNIEELPIYSDLRVNIFNPIQKKDKETGGFIYYRKTVEIFLKKLRNGIAHQNIQAINENGSFVGVIIRNKFRSIVDFEVAFRRRELQKFANFIADQYLQRANN